jgi:hypothetical protein
VPDNYNGTESDFDVDGWTKKILSTVEQFRSDVPSNPTVAGSAKEQPPGQKGESQLNCFYRLIGLPATRDESLVRGKEASILSQHNTLNYFKPEQIFQSQREVDNSGNEVFRSEPLTKLSQREQMANRLPGAQDFVDIIATPPKISDLGTPDSTAKHTSIFPLVVDASVPIFPQAHRTAPLFFDGDCEILNGERVRLPRTFLETVIFIRTKLYSQNTDLVNTVAVLTNSGDDEVIRLSLEEIAAGVQKSEKTIPTKLIIAIQAAAENYLKAVRDAAELQKKIRFVPIQQLPEDGGTKSSTEELFELVDERGEKIPFEAQPFFDFEYRSLKEQKAALASTIIMLPTTGIKEAEKLTRLKNNRNRATITDDLFTAEFLDLMQQDRDGQTLDLRIAEAEQKRRRSFRDFEIIKDKLFYSVGGTNRLSIIVILCIFLALFTVDLKHVLSVLNPSALERLKSNRFFRKGASPGDFSIFQDAEIDTLLSEANSTNPILALSEIEAAVKRNLNLAQAFFDRAANRS